MNPPLFFYFCRVKNLMTNKQICRRGIFDKKISREKFLQFSIRRRI